ncbi:MAG: ABC transporter permease [Candidatus Brocadiae bacterium]|nr:ABC transporter permease [Candidatus Brocadiia bacterium]
MAIYILRRILLMIPTFIAISFIIFLIVNLAPGDPGELASSQGQESAGESGSKREATRIFKAQFHLNKPIVFNLRYGIEEKEILGYLEKISRQTTASTKELIEAEEILENYGQYALPSLASILEKTNNEEIRRVALRVFKDNSLGQQFRDYRNIAGKEAAELVEEFHKKNPSRLQDSEYQRELLYFVNREIGKRNEYIRSLNYTKEDSPEKQKDVLEKVLSWYKNHSHWYTYSFWEKAAITFCDTRFAHYWYNLLHFDFGISHVDKQPVVTKVMEKLRYSVVLSLASIFLSYLIAVPLGIFSAVKRNSLADKSITVLLFMLYSLPTFFVGTLLLQFFSAGGDYWHFFPTGGFIARNYVDMTTFDQLKSLIWHIFLPLICLTYAGLASLSRYARSGLLDVIRADYIKTARAKGLPEYLVILRHAVRNGMIPVLTLLASVLPVLIGGSVVIEFIFAIDGMGSLMLLSITAKDYNTIMCISLISAILVMLGILLSDISYALVDPRISFK